MPAPAKTEARFAAAGRRQVWVELKSSYLIGDRWRDIGRAGGWMPRCGLIVVTREGPLVRFDHAGEIVHGSSPMDCERGYIRKTQLIKAVQ
jgi:hypothetical protein